MLYDINNGVRNHLTYTDAMLNNSLFSDYLKSIKINRKKALTITGKDKNECTRDLICLDFEYGSRSFDDEMKRLNKMLCNYSNEDITIKYDKSQLKKTIKRVYKNKDKYDKQSRDKIREIYYINGCDITYHDKDKKNKDKIVDHTIHYKMLFRTSAKAKLGQVIFINESLYDKAYDWMTMGLGNKMPHDNAKIVEMSAYAPLTTSTIINKIHIDVDDILILEDQDSFFRTIAKVVYAEEYHPKNNPDIISKKCAVKTEEVELKNTLWDGLCLIESSVLPFYINGMCLLRNHFFKACGLRTHIQKFFKDWCMLNGYDYATYKVKDMFGKQHYLKDIKMITTNNAIKWLKFKDIMGKTPRGAYTYWCNRIKKDGNYWGVVKTDHKSKLGDNQQMSYQMINTLPCKKEDVYEIAKESISYVEMLKSNNDEFEKYLRKNATVVNHYEMMADLYQWNKDFANSKWFRNEKKKIIRSYVNRLRNGKINIHGDNLTIFGNPYALLLYSVGEDWKSDPTLKKEKGCIQCYTPRFNNDEYLCGIRNPHNSPNNLMYFHNVYSKEFKKYFQFSSNIMAVNCIETDIQDRANGCDFDSDFLFVTNHSTMVECSRIAYQEYPTIVNKLKESGLTYNNTPKEYARMDNKFSKSRLGIGWSSNLAQLALTYYWTELSKEKPDENLLKDLYDNFVILSVLAQVIIDGCKREYEIDGMEEIKRIQSMNCMNRYIINEFGKKQKLDYPLFMKYTKTIQTTKNGKPLPFDDLHKNRNKIRDRIDCSLNCPMNDLQLYLDKIQNTSGNNSIPTEEFFIKLDGQPTARMTEKMIKLVKEYTNGISSIRSNYSNNKELYQYEIESLTESVISKFRKFRFKNKKTINRLIEMALCIQEDNGMNLKIESKYSVNLLNVIYQLNKSEFLKNNFIKNA